MGYKGAGVGDDEVGELVVPGEGRRGLRSHSGMRG